MPSTCSAYGCTNRNLPGNKLHFFKFPFRYPALVTKWTRALRRKHFKPTKHSRICSVHFLPNDYSNQPGERHMTLKHTAVPSNFPNTKNQMKSNFVMKLEKRQKASILRNKMVNVTEKKSGNIKENLNNMTEMEEDSSLDEQCDNIEIKDEIETEDENSEHSMDSKKDKGKEFKCQNQRENVIEDNIEEEEIDTNINQREKDIEEREKNLEEREKVVEEMGKKVEKQVEELKNELNAVVNKIKDMEKNIMETAHKNCEGQKLLEEIEKKLKEREKKIEEKAKKVWSEQKNVMDTVKKICKERKNLEAKEKILIEKEKIIEEKEKVMKEKERIMENFRLES